MLLTLLAVVASGAGFMFEWRRSERDTARVDALAARVDAVEDRISAIAAGLSDRTMSAEGWFSEKERDLYLNAPKSRQGESRISHQPLLVRVTHERSSFDAAPGRGDWQAVRHPQWACPRPGQLAISTRNLVDEQLDALDAKEGLGEIVGRILCTDCGELHVKREDCPSQVTLALRVALEVPTTATIWGEPHTFTPAVCSKVFGDGRALLKLWALSTRPCFYVVRIDSRWKVSVGEAPESVPNIYITDHRDEIYDALVDDFSDAGPHEGDDGEFTLEWPAFDGDSGASWGRMDWPALEGWTFERHPFATCNILSRRPQ